MVSHPLKDSQASYKDKHKTFPDNEFTHNQPNAMLEDSTVSKLKATRQKLSSISENKRYSKEWSQQYSLGFAAAYVTSESFKITFYEVNKGVCTESKSVYL